MELSEVFTLLPQAFLSERAAGINATVCMQVTGAGGGSWYITIKDQQCAVSQTAVPNPRLTISMTAQDANLILAGKLDAMKAYMQGKLRMTGDMNLAMRFTSLFKSP
jgi:putative sterol carrier protein